MNIGILEGPKANTVGAEIYGAGWTFRAYLLWEAFGRARDRDVMVLNLDGFDERRQLASGRWDLRFIAFNPTAKAIQTELIFPLAVERSAMIADGPAFDQISANAGPLTAGRCSIRLDPGEARWLRLNVATS